VKDGYTYDEWTGEMGEPLQQYKEQFQYWDIVLFGPK
jgi:hypothetical protein